MNKITKIILAIFIILVLLGGGFIIWNLNKPKTKESAAGSILKQTANTNQASNTPAVIILSSSSPTIKVGETVTVSINISSRKPSDGTDIVMLYNPSILEVVANAPDKPVALGTIYQEYPVNSDDKKGKITVSGINLLPEGNIASGIFGTVKFKALRNGKANISLDFTKGSTIDTNVIETGSSNDLLEAVQNAEILIN